MGFNLEVFFEELQDIIDGEEENSAIVLADLQKCIEEGKKYAKECSLL